MRIHLFVLLGCVLVSSCNNHQVKGQEIASEKEGHRKKHSDDKPIAFMPDQAAGGCDSLKWKYVYDPERLQVLTSCKVVEGIIRERNADEDGDEHMLLELNKKDEGLLTKKNFKKKDGFLVVEVVCVNNITRKRAMGACNGYVNNVQLPNVGDHVRVTGSYVIDSHNGWAEIHPVSKIEELK